MGRVPLDVIALVGMLRDPQQRSILQISVEIPRALARALHPDARFCSLIWIKSSFESMNVITNSAIKTSFSQQKEGAIHQ